MHLVHFGGGMSGHIKLAGSRFFDWIAAGKQVYTDLSWAIGFAPRWLAAEIDAARRSGTTGSCSPATSPGATTPASTPGCAPRPRPANWPTWSSASNFDRAVRITRPITPTALATQGDDTMQPN